MQSIMADCFRRTEFFPGGFTPSLMIRKLPLKPDMRNPLEHPKKVEIIDSFLDASTHLCKRVLRSVCPSVRNRFFLLNKNGGEWTKMSLHISAFFSLQSLSLNLSLNYPLALFLLLSFFHNLSFTTIPQQSFFNNLSFTIFLQQSFFYKLYSQPLFSIFAKFGTHRCTLGYLFCLSI